MKVMPCSRQNWGWGVRGWGWVAVVAAAAAAAAAHLQRLHLACSSVRVEWACNGAVSTAATGGCGSGKRAQRGVLKPQLGVVMLWWQGRGGGHIG